MNYNKEAMENSKIKLTFDIDSAKWTESINTAYQKTKYKYAIEGFRKGKVPQPMIEKMYGKSVFYEDALDILLQEAYDYVLENDKSVEPIARPDVNVVSISDTGAKFEIIVPVKPEVKLGQYSGLTVKKEKFEVSEEEIKLEVEKARDKAGSWEEINDRPVADKDTVDINYSGSINGVKFEGGSADNQTLVIGSNTFIPGFESQIIGMNKGDVKDIKVTFPIDYGAKDLAGKEAVFNIKLNGIKFKKLPELDDEFAKDVSEFNTYAEYLADVKAKLQKEADDRSDVATENKMVDMIIENTPVDVPEAMIDNQIEQSIKEFEYRLMYQGMKLDDYFKYTNTTKDDLKKQYREQSIKNVKVSLVLEAIIKKEDIKLTEEEIEAAFSEVAGKMNKSVEDFKKSAPQNQKEYAISQKISDKLLKFLKSVNKFED